MEKLPFFLFSSEKQISQFFPFCCSSCFFFPVNVHFVHSSQAWFSLVCHLWWKIMYFWWWTHKTISLRIFWYWHYYWQSLWRIFSSLCLTWGNLYKGGFDYRRMKTKRLTRLSVYVERKNVCKWSLVYLHVGKLLWSFFFAQFFSNILSSQYCFTLGRWREKLQVESGIFKMAQPEETR